MRLSRALLCLTLATSLVGQSLPAVAFAQVPVDDLAAAQELYQQGKSAYDTAEYNEALKLWKQAYGSLPETNEARGIRNALVYNISDAEVKAWEIDQDITHLRKARALLTTYLESHVSLYGDKPEAVAERAEAKGKLQEVEATLAEVEAQAAAPPPEGPPPPSAAGSAFPDPRTNPEYMAQYRKHRGLIIGGWVSFGVTFPLWFISAGLGVAALSSDTVDLATDSTEDTANRQRALAGVFGVLGLATLTTGIVLFSVGYKRRNNLKRNYAATGQVARVDASPWRLRDGGGLQLRLRF